jgi:hypothetical protein
MFNGKEYFGLSALPPVKFPSLFKHKRTQFKKYAYTFYVTDKKLKLE